MMRYDDVTRPIVRLQFEERRGTDRDWRSQKFLETTADGGNDEKGNADTDK